MSLVILEISKEWIDQNYNDEILLLLNSLVEDQKSAIGIRNQCLLIVSGYDDDTRELYEIAEVRNYLKELDKRFPYWFYFLMIDKNERTLDLITFCCCGIHKHPDGKLEIDFAELKNFVLSHFSYMNVIYKKFDISMQINESISKQITEYYFGNIE